MTSGYFESSDGLRDENNHGYGLLPIPSPRDVEISAVIRNWLTMDGLLRSAAMEGLGGGNRFTLIGYGERMASLAVRERNRECLILGLVALGLDGWRGDWRDNAVVVCLFFDAARRIGLEPGDVFEEAAGWLLPVQADFYREFVRRSGRDQGLDAMGYVAGDDGDGFRYRRTW